MPFWRGKRVFLTGHTGFKGAWLSLWLSDLGADVTGYSLPPPTDPSLFDIARVRDVVRHIEGDVRDGAALTRALSDASPEIVIHMAAQTIVRVSYSEPVATFATNVMGTVNVLEAVRQVGGVRAVVCVTSDKCYENRGTGVPCREDDAMGGHDPYSSSKGCSELVVSSYRHSFFPVDEIATHGVAVGSVRAGNVIGGGDWAKDRLVPDLMRAFSTGARPLIRFPNAVRPWQHVLEPLSGYMRLARRLWEGDAVAAGGWNFGPEETDARSVGWIADRASALWGDGAGWDCTGDPQPHEDKLLRLDCSKARERLGWRPTWGLDEGLARTVEWYGAALKGSRMDDVTREQIRSHPAHSALLG
jgi:CDP-glucose 4,6-dehydratase